MRNEYSFVVLLFSLLFISTTGNAQTRGDKLTSHVHEISDPLQKVMSLQPIVYRYDTNKFKDIRLPKGDQYGFDIEAAHAVLPELVSDRKYSYAIGKNTFRAATVRQFNSDHLVPFLVGAIQEQQTEIDQLKTEIELLKKLIKDKE
jgi:hypothetical protein